MSPNHDLGLSLAAGDTTSAGLSDLNSSFLADIPPIAIGILGFASAKWLFVFNALNRPIKLILLSIFAVFLGVMFDLFRIFQASNDPRDQSTRSLLILRELFLASGLFIRYLFYLEYASRWPDSDTSVDNLTVRWSDWQPIRLISEGLLFVVVFIMYVLQLVWRMNGSDSVYTADVVLQLSWTTVILLKMGYSIAVFPDPSLRWRFAKLVLPIMLALVIEWGVSIGNAVMRDFADCSAGRFLQAVEVYIIVLALMGASISRLISQGPLSTLPSAFSEKGPRRFGGINISKPTLPAGLPKFSFRTAPRRAPRPPTDLEGPQQPEEQQSRWRLSTWLAARVSGERRAMDDGSHRTRIILDPTPIGTPELNEWRGKLIPPNPPDMPPLPPSEVMDVTAAPPRALQDTAQDSGIDLSDEKRITRSYAPPISPPPAMPLPAPPRVGLPRPAPTLPPLETNLGDAISMRWSNAPSRTSTFGAVAQRMQQQQTATTMSSTNDTNISHGSSRSAADPVLGRRQSFIDSDTDGSSKKRDRRSSLPLLSAVIQPPISPNRPTSMAPNSGVMTQSLQQLMREQEALDEAYPTRSPRLSIASTAEGANSEESTMPPAPQVLTPPIVESPRGSLSLPDFAMRNSTRSTFSLSKFPAPPAARLSQAAPTSFLQRPLTTASRFSSSSSGSGPASSNDSTAPRPPSKESLRPQLTVDTDVNPPQRPPMALGLPPNPRRTAWDVTSFISGASLPPTSTVNLSSASTLAAPPPSVVSPGQLMSPPAPFSTMSSSPSPRLPRPAPRRNRNVDRASTMIPLPSGPAPIVRPKSVVSSLSDDETAQTGSATRARRVSRVRFVENPPQLPRPPPLRVTRPPVRGSIVEDDEEMGEVRLAGRVVPLGVGTMPVAMFRSGGATKRSSTLGPAPSRP